MSGPRTKGNALSENTAAGTDADQGAVDAGPDAVDRHAGNGDAVLHFVGGPLDGRVEIRPAPQGAPRPVITHVHLHDGPKVVHRYDLEPLSDGVGVYNLRPPVRRPVRDEAD